MCEKREKVIKVTFENPEAKMQLKVKGPKATENALKIMTTFDSACKEIREGKTDV